MSEITTAVKVCNAALGRLGQPPISAIGESTQAGQACDINYEATRNALLRSHPWNFAIKRATLASDDTETALIPFEYDYAFTLPTDCLKVIRTSQESLGLPHDYVVTRRFLYTNEDSVSIEYIYKATTVTEYDPLFLQLLILDLAIAMCMPLADSNSLLQTLQQARKELAPSAMTTDAQEGSANQIVDNEGWLQARI